LFDDRSLFDLYFNKNYLLTIKWRKFFYTNLSFWNIVETVKNNIVACLCNAFYTNLYLWNTTIQYNTIQYNTNILFPIKDPFRAEQLTKNLIQWLWIDYIDWKMTTFYETRHTTLHCMFIFHVFIGIFSFFITRSRKW
jgi:hypothetical protein